METISDVLKTLDDRSTNLSKIGRDSGLARATIYNIIRNPKKRAFWTLERFFDSLGYEIILRRKGEL